MTLRKNKKIFEAQNLEVEDGDSRSGISLIRGH
jgi:hypothetical protein